MLLFLRYDYKNLLDRKWPKLKIAKIENYQQLLKVAILKIVKIESSQNWKLPKLKVVEIEFYKFPKLKVTKIVNWQIAKLWTCYLGAKFLST